MSGRENLFLYITVFIYTQAVDESGELVGCKGSEKGSKAATSGTLPGPVHRESSAASGLVWRLGKRSTQI